VWGKRLVVDSRNSGLVTRANRKEKLKLWCETQSGLRIWPFVKCCNKIDHINHGHVCKQRKINTKKSMRILVTKMNTFT